MAGYNPFQGKELKFPKKYKKKVEGYCQTRPSGGARPSPKDSPFRRQVDLWFLSFCLGLQKNKRSNEPLYKFHTGEVLADDPDKIELLEITAITVLKDPYALKSPEKIINMANEYAATGIGEIFNALITSKSEPLWNLSEYFHSNIKV